MGRGRREAVVEKRIVLGGRWGPQRRGGWGLPAWGEEEEGAHVARKRGAVVTWWEVGPTKEGSYL
jgi:hypothetical protein